MPSGPSRLWSPGAMPLAACARRPREGQRPLPPHRLDEPDGRDTVIFDAVVFDVQVDSRP